MYRTEATYGRRGNLIVSIYHYLCQWWTMPRRLIYISYGSVVRQWTPIWVFHVQLTLRSVWDWWQQEVYQAIVQQKNLTLWVHAFKPSNKEVCTLIDIIFSQTRKSDGLLCTSHMLCSECNEPYYVCVCWCSNGLCICRPFWPLNSHGSSLTRISHDQRRYIITLIFR